MQIKKVLIIPLFFYGLQAFSSDFFSSVPTQKVTVCFPSHVVVPKELFLNIFSFGVPGHSSLIHPERMITYVSELMQYRPVCPSWKDSLDQHINDSITLKKMHYAIVHQCNFVDEGKFFDYYQKYLEMPFLKRFPQFHEAESSLVACFFKVKKSRQYWNKFAGHFNECGGLEALAKEGIVLQSFYVLLQTRQFILWEKLFKTAMESLNNDQQVKTLFACQYLIYVKNFGKIGTFFDKYHYDFEYLASKNKITTIPITLKDDIYRFYSGPELETIDTYVDTYGWLPDFK